MRNILLGASALALTAGTASPENWNKDYGGNEFDGRSVVNFIMSEDSEWALVLVKWDDGTNQAYLIARDSFSIFCMGKPNFEVLANGVRIGSHGFTVYDVDGAIVNFRNVEEVIRLADKYDKIILRDAEGCIDGIIRFDTSGSPDFSW